MDIKPNSYTIMQLLSTANEQFTIPPYQRRYSWTAREIEDLVEDIDSLDGNDSHLLGNIVCLTAAYTGGINQLEVVDGQQRLTTVAIILHCLRQYFEETGEKETAQELAGLLVAKSSTGSRAPKISLDSIDAGEFEDLINKREEVTYKNRRLEAAFKRVREMIEESDAKNLRLFDFKLRNQALIIRLHVSQAKDAFKLFETINNRGLLLSQTDIVKNFLLGNAARFGNDQLEFARRRWADLIGYLDGTNHDSFFRYYLMTHLKKRINNSEVNAEFEEHFYELVTEAEGLPERRRYILIDGDDELADPNADEGVEEDRVVKAKADKKSHTKKISFKKFMDQLIKYAKAFGQIVRYDTGNAAIDRSLQNLKMIKAVQTYGYLMHLRVNGCDEKEFLKVLKLTENFVLRRHVCRERSNETEALFARISAVDAKAPLSQTRAEYRLLCPADDSFKKEFAQAAFTATVIERARYCLTKIAETKFGEHDEIKINGPEAVHVEHIIPQKIKTAKAEMDDWIRYLGDKAEADHSRYVSRIGNMTLFAGPLNIGASNNPFERKKVAYNKSGIAMTNELVKRKEFKFRDVEKRSADLAEVAVELWPKP